MTSALFLKVYRPYLVHLSLKLVISKRAYVDTEVYQNMCHGMHWNVSNYVSESCGKVVEIGQNCKAAIHFQRFAEFVLIIAIATPEHFLKGLNTRSKQLLEPSNEPEHRQ